MSLKNRILSLSFIHLKIQYWFFDKEFYLKTYNDVARSKMDPWLHFTTYGKKEGRSPNHFLLLISGIGFTLHQKKFTSLSPKNMLGDKTAILDLAKDGKFRLLKFLNLIFRIVHAHQNHPTIFFKILSIKDISKKFPGKLTLLKSEPYYYRDPDVIGRKKSIGQYCIKTPEQWISTIKRVAVRDGFIVTQKNTLLLYEPAANPKFGFVAGLWDKLAWIKNTDYAAVITAENNKYFVDEAILISGRCSPNYFHVLIEYFGKSYIVDSLRWLEKKPIIIDANIYPQELDALKILLPNNPVILFHSGSTFHINKLHIPSICTYIPDTLTIPMWKSAAICHPVLQHIRNKIFQAYGIIDNPSSPFDSKIYLTRTNGRVIKNNYEVENLVKEFGFEIVDTSSLTFEQQVRLINSAKFIVAPNGAALSNLIFAREGCEVLCLNSPFTVLFPLFSSLANFSGCKFSVLGGEDNRYRNGDEEKYFDMDVNEFWSSYTINIQSLKDALKRILKANIETN